MLGRNQDSKLGGAKYKHKKFMKIKTNIYSSFVEFHLIY